MMHIKRSETRSPTGNNALMSRRRSDYGGFTLVIVISQRARVATERETDFYRSTSNGETLVGLQKSFLAFSFLLVCYISIESIIIVPLEFS